MAAVQQAGLILSTTMDRRLYKEIDVLLTDSPSSVDAVHATHPEIPRSVILAMFFRKAKRLSRIHGSLVSQANYPKEHFYFLFQQELLKLFHSHAEYNPYEDVPTRWFVMPALCKQLNLSPCQVARLVLKSTAAVFNFGGSTSTTTWLNFPESLSDAAMNLRLDSIDRITINHLSCDLVLCVEADTVFAPAMDQHSHQLGVEAEHQLHAHLKSHNLDYFSEADLRSDGYPKTPDALLPYPISIEVDGEWSTVCWFESKAMFGDDEAHDEYLRNQLWPYYNRFGPGAVIYWYNFIADLRERSLVANGGNANEGVMVLNSFPGCILRIQ